MNYRIDNLQYCNWSRDIFKINRDAGLNAVHATVVYHEDYDEFLIKLKIEYFFFIFKRINQYSLYIKK